MALVELARLVINSLIPAARISTMRTYEGSVYEWYGRVILAVGVAEQRRSRILARCRHASYGSVRGLQARGSWHQDDWAALRSLDEA